MALTAEPHRLGGLRPSRAVFPTAGLAVIEDIGRLADLRPFPAAGWEAFITPRELAE